MTLKHSGRYRSTVMLRPPVTTGRRRASECSTVEGPSYPYPRPPSRVQAAIPSGSSRGVNAAPATIQHAQVKLAAFQEQLKAYMDLDRGNGPLVRALDKREALQGKRAQFFALLQHLLKTQESLSASKVWLCVEKERQLELLSRRCELQIQQTQNQLRIQELLLRTDPKLSDNAAHNKNSSKSSKSSKSGLSSQSLSLQDRELPAALAHLRRVSFLETVEIIARTVQEQAAGYRALAREYVPTLLEEDKERRENFEWASRVVPKLVEGMRGWVEENEGTRRKALARFLRRKREFKALQDMQRHVEGTVKPAAARAEEDLQLMAGKFDSDVALVRERAREGVAQEIEKLRRKVEERQGAWEELEKAQAAIEVGFAARVQEGEEQMARLKTEEEEWAVMRTEARDFFQRALKTVRDRLKAFETQRHAELLGIADMMELYEFMKEEEGGGKGRRAEGEESSEGGGYESDTDEEEGEGEEMTGGGGREESYEEEEGGEGGGYDVEDVEGEDDREGAEEGAGGYEDEEVAGQGRYESDEEIRIGYGREGYSEEVGYNSEGEEEERGQEESGASDEEG